MALPPMSTEPLHEQMKKGSSKYFWKYRLSNVGFLCSDLLWPILLTKFNFNPSMDK